MTEEIRTEELADLIRAEANLASRAGQSDVLSAIADKVERLQRGARELGRTIEQQCNMVLDITGLHDWVDETGDGDWGAIWDHALTLKGRAEKAEADAVAREAAARREALLEAEERVSKAEDELRRVKAASLYADGHMQVIVDMDRRYDRLRAHADQTEQELDKARARVEEYAAIKAHLAASIRSAEKAEAKLARVEALAHRARLGTVSAADITAALAEPERDEEGGR